MVAVDYYHCPLRLDLVLTYSFYQHQSSSTRGSFLVLFRFKIGMNYTWCPCRVAKCRHTKINSDKLLLLLGRCGHRPLRIVRFLHIIVGCDAHIAPWNLPTLEIFFNLPFLSPPSSRTTPPSRGRPRIFSTESNNHQNFQGAETERKFHG